MPLSPAQRDQRLANVQAIAEGRRTARLEAEGFAPDEITRRRLDVIPFTDPRSRTARSGRRQQIATTERRLISRRTPLEQGRTARDAAIEIAQRTERATALRRQRRRETDQRQQLVLTARIESENFNILRNEGIPRNVILDNHFHEVSRDNTALRYFVGEFRKLVRRGRSANEAIAELEERLAGIFQKQGIRGRVEGSLLDLIKEAYEKGRPQRQRVRRRQAA